ncbi:hypothetical protein Cadr_000013810 [Camelus dromedarius]|uniref:Uncharacterized protein n=1 Tax=Camelus dromedarius TaxID=9838 RepID=A0A5N4DDZ2_CAMDR|nr:hypothetical protein Cadr_000013810 [Camelus dromedarius]
MKWKDKGQGRVGGQSEVQKTAKMLTWPLKSPQPRAGLEEGKGKEDVYPCGLRVQATSSGAGYTEPLGQAGGGQTRCGDETLMIRNKGFPGQSKKTGKEGQEIRSRKMRHRAVKQVDLESYILRGECEGRPVDLGRGKGGLWVENEVQSGEVVKAVGSAGRRLGEDVSPILQVEPAGTGDSDCLVVSEAIQQAAHTLEASCF